MAEFELKLKEENPAQRACLYFMALLFPVWGLAVPGAVVLFIVLLLRLPSTISIGFALAFVFLLLCFSAFCAFITFLVEDDEIRVSKEGLSFPPLYFGSLKSRLERSWKELSDLKLNWTGSAALSAQDQIVLLFKDGGFARLVLSRLNPAELEQFLIAFEACQIACNRDAQLDDFEYMLQSANKEDGPSYSEIWEKSLSAKFSGATFSPLEPAASLQNGRYRILRQLGFGGFAAVYLARYENGDYRVLKEAVFPDGGDLQVQAQGLFQREFSILAKLEHPKIARVYDYFVENSRHYLSMEYIDGCDLARVSLKEGPLPEDVTLGLLEEISEILVYLHERSQPVLHRDLSPENLILRGDGSVSLIDFGAAKEIASSFSGTVIGKQSYIAPEQFQGKAVPASDVYSFAACAFLLLTAKLPPALSQLSPAAIREDLSAELDKLIKDCSELDHEMRPAAKEVLERIRGMAQERKEKLLQLAGGS